VAYYKVKAFVHNTLMLTEQKQNIWLSRKRLVAPGVKLGFLERDFLLPKGRVTLVTFEIAAKRL